MKKSKEVNVTNDDKDIMFLTTIQPQGNISFSDERFIKSGSGYETVIHIYELPGGINTHWLAKLCNIQNVITTIDIATEDIIKVKKNINKSMQEQSSRYDSGKNHQERYDAQKRYQEMEALYDELDSMDEVVKILDIRIFIYDRTWMGLDEKVAKIMESLETDGYRNAIFLNETKNEWTSLYKPYKKQQEELFQVEGVPLISAGVAGGNPFHFVSLDDETGSFLGYTQCGGNVFFDEFLKTKTRLFYNSVVVGNMRSGKSTLLKKRFKDRAIRGDFIRTFDITGEFTKLTKNLGGKIIKLDGSNGMLNPLEILRSGETEGTSFMRHISKVSTLYKFLVPYVDDIEIIDFQTLLRELYETNKLTPQNTRGKERQITGLAPNKYPKFTDLLNLIIKKQNEMIDQNYTSVVQQDLVKNNLLILEKIRKTVENIINNYGEIFNGYTSIDNILDEQIVTFDLSQVKEMDENIFDASIFNMLSLCWDNCVTNGSIMKKQWENDEIKWNDIVRFLILIDESHRWVNTKKTQSLELLGIYLREAPKFFGGIMLASQSIRDYVPEDSGNNNVDKIKTIFELTQYKFIFHQDTNVLPLIDKVFGNILTESQKYRIPKLGQGENILSIASDKTLEFKVNLTKEEDKLFTGGA